MLLMKVKIRKHDTAYQLIWNSYYIFLQLIDIMKRIYYYDKL